MEYENSYRSLVFPTTSKGVIAPMTEPKRVNSEQLLGPKKELVILHNGREYRLRMTQNGKLILTA